MCSAADHLLQFFLPTSLPRQTTRDVFNLTFKHSTVFKSRFPARLSQRYFRFLDIFLLNIIIQVFLSTVVVIKNFFILFAI